MPFHVPPQQDPRAQQQPGGPLSPPVSPGMPQGAPAAPQGLPRGFPGGEGRMNELYGLMAANAQNPAEIGQGYVNANQRQQALDRYADPTEQMLRLYGNVNPYDFTAQSLKAFEESRRKTGQLDFGLLVRMEDLSSVEEKQLGENITKAQDAELLLGRMGATADQFDELARQGISKGRLAGGMREWMKGIFGMQDDQVSQAIQQFKALKNDYVLTQLPPGIASDKDIELARGTWPDENANPAFVASFLRGVQKIQAIKLTQASHAAAFMSRNRTQMGMLDDWNINKEKLIRYSLQQYGGVYNPRDASGKEISYQDAANLRYNNRYVGGFKDGAGPPVSGVSIPQGGVTAPRGGVADNVNDPLNMFPNGY